jgi:hypothetical protein
MHLVRIVFLGLAVLLPTTWTIAHAGDEAPAGEAAPAEGKKAKKSKKSKKADGADKEKKAE